MPWEIEMPLQLTLATPLHTGTGAGVAGYLDAGTLLDHEGFPYLAGSTLKGRLRYYLCQLLPTLEPVLAQQTAIVALLFGTTGQPGALIFDDLRLSVVWRNLFQVIRAQSAELRPVLTQPRPHVTLSRLRGVALEQRLFTIETVPAHFSFTGMIHGYLPDEVPTLSVGDATAPRALALLTAACCALTHLGGRKSRGLGRCTLTFAAQTMQINGTSLTATQLLEALQ